MFIGVGGVAMLKDGKRSSKQKIINIVDYDDMTLFFISPKRAALSSLFYF